MCYRVRGESGELMRSLSNSWPIFFLWSLRSREGTVVRWYAGISCRILRLFKRSKMRRKIWNAVEWWWASTHHYWEGMYDSISFQFSSIEQIFSKKKILLEFWYIEKEMPHLFLNAIIVLLCACTAQQKKIDWHSLVLCGDVRPIYLFVASKNSSSWEHSWLTDRNSRPFLEMSPPMANLCNLHRDQPRWPCWVLLRSHR